MHGSSAKKKKGSSNKKIISSNNSEKEDDVQAVSANNNDDNTNSSNNNNNNNNNNNDNEKEKELTKDDLWKNKDLKSQWYEPATDYWKQQELSVNGMLGGYGFISDVDVDGSYKFIKSFLDGSGSMTINTEYAIDCGAGIGRITKDFLTKVFKKVDLIEQSANFLEKAKLDLVGNDHVGEYFCSGLQDFNPQHGKYDCIWIQWVLLYLTDSDLVEFLKRCKLALKPNGMIFVKENTLNDGDFVLDKSDNSLTRADESYREIFEKAGLGLRKTQLQPKFPKELFPVRMYALS